MNLPKSIPDSIKCPTCMPFDTSSEQLAKLEWQKYPGSLTEHLAYYCENCKNGFTTTESDEISLKRYNNKKRSIVRKNKINKINEL